jgi:glycosyltransferase involved in cell wall biosynthesis
MFGKKILLISPSSLIGGKASFTQNLILAFKQTGIKFYHIDLVRARSNNLFLRFLEHLHSIFYYKIKVIKLLITKPIDIVQIHTSSRFDFYDLSLIVMLSKLFRKHIILRYGGGAFPSFYQNAHWLKRKYIKRVLLISDVVIVLSEYWNEYFKNIGIKNIILVPNFVDERQYFIVQNKYDEPFINILFMPGQSLNGKGFFQFKDTIKIIAEQNPNVIFHLVGNEVDKYIGGNNILTYKEISGELKINLFSKCQVFLLLTQIEGFPNSLIEAMAAGMAVITTNIPPITCLVTDKHDCLQIDFGANKQLEDNLLFLIKIEGNYVKSELMPG